ncbi:acyltransferase [Agaricicola taiwanensis]|uniref:Acyltransferase n=1 Tax=Agaricicola taiwanensis TaxID=591372 RepID=A0A8J2YKX2_9RHOB|nr:acyltransferase family protein [Agaricicola taiwanensis]GGE48879.1 acyltransferase [Agaricicola taiwanensis]
MNASAPVTATAARPLPGSRTGWVDAAKGFTITLVVAHHALEGLKLAGLANPTFLYWHDILLSVRMPLFFLVAGLFARKAIYGDFRKFLDSKVFHFAYFYVLWSVISLLLRYAANPVSNNKVALTDILFIGWDPISTIWFLYGLALAFVITRALRHMNPCFLVAFAAMVQAAAFAFPSVPYLVIINKFAYLYVYFVLGVYGSEWIREQADKANYPKIIAALVLFIALAVVLRLNDLLFTPLCYFVLSMLSAYAIIGFFSRAREGLFARLFEFIGAYSMPIYLTHFLPVAAARIILVKVFGITNFGVLFTAATTAGVLFGVVAFLIAVRTPFRFVFVRPKALTLDAPATLTGREQPSSVTAG